MILCYTDFNTACPSLLPDKDMMGCAAGAVQKGTLSKACLKYLFDSDVPDIPKTALGGLDSSSSSGNSQGQEWSTGGYGGGETTAWPGADVAGSGSIPGTPDPFDLSFFKPGERNCIDTIVYQCQHMAPDKVDGCLTKAMGILPACQVD